MSEAPVHETHTLWSLWERLPSLGDAGQPLLIRAEDGLAHNHAEISEIIDQVALTLAAQPGQGAVACTLPNGPLWLAWLLACAREPRPFIPLDPANREHAASTAARLGAGLLVTEDGAEKIDPQDSLGTGWAVGKVTSGSTQAPKLVPCRDSHLIADGRQIIATMGIRPSDRNLALIPFGFSYGLGNLVLPLLLQGSAVVYADSFLLGQVPVWIEQHGVTVLPSVPGIFRLLTKAVDALPDALRLCISAGAPLSPEVAQAFEQRFGRRIHNFYGSSETGGICYDRDGALSLTGRAVGTPLEGVDVEIGPDGKITVSSPAVAKPGQRWVLPDRGELTDAGLCLRGRLDRLLNLNGKKLKPDELESLLCQHPDIDDAFVYLLGDESRPRLCAAVATALDRASVLAYLSAHVPAWQVPRHLNLCAALPRDARGKVTREAVLQAFDLA